MFFLITSVFISAASATVEFECSSSSSSGIANEMGLESGSWRADFYRWDGGKVPYYFSNRVTQQDKMFVKKQMEIIESNTCVRFIEHSQSPIPSHHMKIDTGTESCVISDGFERAYRFSAGVNTGQNGLEVLFESRYQIVDQSGCLEHNGRGVIHELFHALGAMHTHKRMDRDDYITYDGRCLIDQSYQSQFDKEEYPLPTDTEEIEYEFASIMHYGCNTFSNGQCNTIEPKDGTPCSALGSNPLPTDTDWEMIRQWHCDADTRTTSKPDIPTKQPLISTKQPLISTRQPNIPVWPWNWWPQTPICAYTDYADPVLCDLGRIWNWCESNEYIRRECAATCNC